MCFIFEIDLTRRNSGFEGAYVCKTNSITILRYCVIFGECLNTNITIICF